MPRRGEPPTDMLELVVPHRDERAIGSRHFLVRVLDVPLGDFHRPVGRRPAPGTAPLAPAIGMASTAAANQSLSLFISLPSQPFVHQLHPNGCLRNPNSADGVRLHLFHGVRLHLFDGVSSIPWNSCCRDLCGQGWPVQPAELRRTERTCLGAKDCRWGQTPSEKWSLTPSFEWSLTPVRSRISVFRTLPLAAVAPSRRCRPRSPLGRSSPLGPATRRGDGAG